MPRSAALGVPAFTKCGRRDRSARKRPTRLFRSCQGESAAGRPVPNQPKMLGSLTTLKKNCFVPGALKVIHFGVTKLICPTFSILAGNRLLGTARLRVGSLVCGLRSLATRER